MGRPVILSRLVQWDPTAGRCNFSNFIALNSPLQGGRRGVASSNERPKLLPPQTSKGCIRRLPTSIPHHAPPRSPCECRESGDKVLPGAVVAEEDAYCGTLQL